MVHWHRLSEELAGKRPINQFCFLLIGRVFDSNVLNYFFLTKEFSKMQTLHPTDCVVWEQLCDLKIITT